MEQVVQERIYSGSESQPPPLKLSPFLLIVLSVLIGFAVITVGTRTLAQYTVPQPNPFEPFADIFPGESRSAFVSRGFISRGFICHLNYLPPVSEICAVNLPSGDFTSIYIIFREDRIENLTFILRGETLRIGDVLTLFGISKTHQYGGKYKYLESHFFWLHDMKVSILSYTGRSPLFVPVSSISFSLE